MTKEELSNLIDKVINSRSEFQNIELKASRKGCPEKLYDSLSSFSNNDDGGIIIFGIDEKAGFEKCGVYNLQDLQQRITEQCNEMSPKVRPLLSYIEIASGCYIMSAEIPSMDIADRPCFYSGKGRLKGSYVRVGTSDEPMTEYEIYSYEAYRRKYQDDIRPIPRATDDLMNLNAIADYIKYRSENKPQFSLISEEKIQELTSIKINGEYTLASTLLFGLYPQAFFPQLCIIATVLPGSEVGELGMNQERFSDNLRIEGTIKDMLAEAISFVKKNTKTKTIIDPQTGERKDKADYPITAVREVVLNALVHRDYSIHTEGMPIQLQIFPDKLVVTNPGGLYGRIRLSQLGEKQADTRNPVLATALETMKLTENRYSGIPTIRREMREAGLPMPQFENKRDSFCVTLFGERKNGYSKTTDETSILTFCSTPRSREEIAAFLGIASVAYAITRYVTPLVKEGKIVLSNPESPKSPKQRYVAK